MYDLIEAMFAASCLAFLFDSFRELRQRKTERRKSYSERLTELTSSLTAASAQVDSVLQELATVAQEKEDSVKKLESGLNKLDAREKELKQTIETLQNVPLPVAEHFAKLVEPSERRSARRDYMLFGAGVIVTTLITILLRAFATK